MGVGLVDSMQNLKFVDQRIEDLRKQADETNDQWEREDIGEKLNLLYKQRLALTPKKAS